MQADIETALMLRVASGDAEAMAALFRHAYRDVRTLCARMTLDDDAADDLAQETFLRVLRYAKGFRGEARFSTWVFRIARNVCNRHLNHMSRDRKSALMDVAPADSRASRDSERIELLRHALAQLPGGDREVVVLSRLRDLSYRELANVLECTESTARVRVHRALRRLRDIMLRLEQPDAV
jgi:RNA polymerase sigma-70 factor (ECF subfamily)